MSVKYLNTHGVRLRAKSNDKEYDLSLSFMNGYPRFNVWEIKKGDDKNTLFAVITFTAVNLLTVLDSVSDIIQDEEIEPFEIDSINHVYIDSKSTEELESRGKMFFHYDKGLVITVKHKGKTIVFRVQEDTKYLKQNGNQDKWVKSLSQRVIDIYSMSILKVTTTIGRDWEVIASK